MSSAGFSKKCSNGISVVFIICNAITIFINKFFNNDNMQAELPEENGKGNYKTKETGSGETVSFFDINQLELAFINRAIKEDIKKHHEKSQKRMLGFTQIGKKKRTLILQKLNLEALLRKSGKEHQESKLDGELKRVLSGERKLSLRCYAPIFDN